MTLKYARIVNSIVMEIIPEYDPLFPNIPLSKRYSDGYVSLLTSIPESTDCQTGWIYNQETKVFIAPDFVPEKTLISELIADKLLELSTDCEQTIVAGVTITDDAGDHVYSLTLEDQTNIIAWSSLAKIGKSVPYHANGELCKVYTPSDFLKIAGAATYYKASQQTYYNCLKQQVMSLTDVDIIKAVKYGVTKLYGVYQDTYDTILAVIMSETAG